MTLVMALLRALCIACLAVCFFPLVAQEKFALRNAPWAAVHASAYNPAVLVESWANAQLTLFALDVHGRTDAFTYASPVDMARGVINHDTNGQARYAHPLNGTQTDFSLRADVLNVLLSGEKSGLGFGARLHNRVTAHDAGLALVAGVMDGVNSSDPEAQCSSPLGNFRLSDDMYAELYVSLAHRLVAGAHHRLDLGVTARLLNGLYTARGVMEASDTYWDRTGGVLKINRAEGWAVHGDASVMEAFRDLSLNSFLNGGDGKGWGFDAGVSYQFHRKNAASYLFKLGVSVKDIGKIKYKHGLTRYDVAVHAPAEFRTDVQFGVSPDMEDVVNGLLDHYTATGEVTAQAAPYTVQLPATLYLTTDWHLLAPLYLSANAVWPAAEAEESPSVTGRLLNVTPRLDMGRLVFAVPATYSERYGCVNLGAAVVLGHFFAGTDDILEVIRREIHGLNCYIGYTFNLGKAARIVY